MSDSIHPRPGRILAGKYQLEAMLGEGAMGTVWRATHLNLRQQVAVKLILPELADSEAARQRFDAEAKAAAALRSRFVVQIFDSGISEDGVPYLVMEYLTGESLEARVERTGPLPLEQAVQVIGQVARGLARAHAQEIVHRDLKPANVYLAETEDGEAVAKILDFGIAKVRAAAPSVSSTATGAVVGTPLFMSPEQARGSKQVDHRSDLYSLGMMAYWVLTGKHAFAGEALGELIVAICTHPLPSLLAASPGLPPAMERWFAQVCAREPGDRFVSADALVEALVTASGVEASALLASGVLARARGEGRPSYVSQSDIQRTDVRSNAGVVYGETLVVGAATATGVVQTANAPKRRILPVGALAAGVLGLGAVAGAAVLLFGMGRPAPVAPPSRAEPTAESVTVAAPDTPQVEPVAPVPEPTPERPEPSTSVSAATANPAPVSPPAHPAGRWPVAVGTGTGGKAPPLMASAGPAASATSPLSGAAPGIDIGF